MLSLTRHLDLSVLICAVFYTSQFYFRKMNIKDKVFIVTGGASGLGFATAKMIIENQYFIC